MRTCARIALVVSVTAALEAGAVDVTYEVAVRSDVRGRTPLPGDQSAAFTTDLELNPRAQGQLAWSTTTLGLQYTPRLLWREPQIGGRFLPLQRGRIALGHRWGRANLLVAGDGAYGYADIGALRTDQNPLTQVGEVQTLGGIQFVRAAGLVSLQAQPSGRLTLDFTGGYAYSGSPERPQAMPLQWGPTATFNARVGATRVDGFISTASLTHIRLSTGEEQGIAYLRETWDRQLSRTLQLNLGAGVAVTRMLIVSTLDQTLPEGPRCDQRVPRTCVDVLPVALASLNWRDSLRGMPFRLNLQSTLQPFADRFTGNVYERLEGRAAAEWEPLRDFAVRSAGGAAYAVPIGQADQAGDRLVFGELSAQWRPKPWLILQAAGRALWTEQPRFGNAGLFQAVATISATVQQGDSTAW